MASKHRVEISPEVERVLRAAKVEGNNLILQGTLDRKLYEATNKVIELLGGKWNRKDKAHVFPSDFATILDDALGSGEILDTKKAFQFFETPRPVVNRMMELAEVEMHHTCLEPSAGRGAIADVLADLSNHVSCCEIQPENQEKLRQLALSVVGDDFLTLSVDLSFDRIVANPPFCNGQDVEHVTKMFAHLKPGGRLVAIMSPGWTFREDKKHIAFRELFERFGTHKEELPEGTFKESGTNVRTVLVVMDKPLAA